MPENLNDKDKSSEYINNFLHKSFLNPKIGIIIHYRNNTKTDFNVNVEDLRKSLGDDAIILETFSKKDIYHALAEFRYHKIPVVGFLGENSSLHCIISSLIDVHGENNMPMLIPFKGKDKSIIANEINLDKDIGILSHRIIKHYEKLGSPHHRSLKTEFIERNCLKISITEQDKPYGEDSAREISNKTSINKDIKTDVYYGFFFGMGAIYRLMKLLYEGDKKVINSVKSFTRTYFSILFNSDLADHLLSKDRCAIRINSPKRNGLEKINRPRCLLTIASPLRKILDYHPFDNIQAKSSHPDTFNFMTAEINRNDMLKGLPFYIRGNYGKLEKEGYVISEKASEVEIYTNAGIMVDGDIVKHYSQDRSYIIRLTLGPKIKFPVL